jgi:peptidyl-dipeptidase Dcp
VLAEVVALRGEYARLMGYDTFAAYSLEDTMAKTPQAVDDLLSRVWTVALERAGEETQAFAEQARVDGENHPVEAWDNRYYAEKVRKARYDFDQSVLRPYLALDAMIAAAFYTANRLFGLSFEEIKDAPRYHPDARVWAVKGQGGEAVGAFIGDYFARPGKRSGAWMSSFRSQQRLDGDVRPIIVNVMNFARGAEGQPTLLSLDDARTLFHEFGHALHGMLSNVVYPSISGTSVSRDFVELPSQLYEHWLTTPEILERFARHVETGEAIPAELVEKMKAAKNFNQGHATVEFTSSALVDMALYSQPAGVEIDPLAFEAQTLAKLGMPKTITMRHRLPHFMHIVGGYAAGYYSYMWSEVMDADAFAAFEETGDVFDPQTAERLRQHIYSAGNSRDPQELWMSFRGRAPSVEGLLKNRGFA